MHDRLTVQIACVGHASRRWKGAQSASWAEMFNQSLSEAPVQTVRKATEAIVKQELPDLPIVIASRVVGSNEPFPARLGSRTEGDGICCGDQVS